MLPLLPYSWSYRFSALNVIVIFILKSKDQPLYSIILGYQQNLAADSVSRECAYWELS